MATETGALIPPMRIWGANVPSPKPKSTETSPDAKFATARSSCPSELKSPIAAKLGLSPTAKCIWGPNVPSPKPRSTETSPEAEFVTARSWCPSELKSPRTEEEGNIPTSKIGSGKRGAAPVGLPAEPARSTAIKSGLKNVTATGLSRRQPVFEPEAISPSALMCQRASRFNAGARLNRDALEHCSLLYRVTRRSSLVASSLCCVYVAPKPDAHCYLTAETAGQNQAQESWGWRVEALINMRTGMGFAGPTNLAHGALPRRSPLVRDYPVSVRTARS